MVGDLDAQRPASAPLDLLDPELDLVGTLLVVGQGEHHRRLGPGAAGLVRVRAGTGHGGQSDGGQKGARPVARQLSVQRCLLARHPTLAGPTQET